MIPENGSALETYTLNGFHADVPAGARDAPENFGETLDKNSVDFTDEFTEKGIAATGATWVPLWARLCTALSLILARKPSNRRAILSKARAVCCSSL
jgi:hypothetical protein